MSALSAMQHSRTRAPGKVDGRAMGMIAPGLVMWLDASQERRNHNDAVAQWDDLSGMGNHALAGSGTAYYRSNVMNGMPALHFDGTCDLYMSSLDAGSNNVIAFVIRPAVAKCTGVFDSAPGKINTLWQRNGYWTWWNNAPIFSLGLTGSALCVVTLRHSLNPARRIDYWRDGAFVGSYTSSRTNAANWAQPSIGSTNNRGFFYKGYIFEMMVYQRALSDSEMALLNAWLVGKYGL